MPTGGNGGKASRLRTEVAPSDEKDASDDADGRDDDDDDDDEGKRHSTLRLSAACNLCATWKISRKTAMIKITFLINITDTLGVMEGY